MSRPPPLSPPRPRRPRGRGGPPGRRGPRRGGARGKAAGAARGGGFGEGLLAHPGAGERPASLPRKLTGLLLKGMAPACASIASRSGRASSDGGGSGDSAASSWDRFRAELPRGSLSASARTAGTSRPPGPPRVDEPGRAGTRRARTPRRRFPPPPSRPSRPEAPRIAPPGRRVGRRPRGRFGRRRPLFRAGGRLTRGQRLLERRTARCSFRGRRARHLLAG